MDGCIEGCSLVTALFVLGGAFFVVIGRASSDSLRLRSCTTTVDYKVGTTKHMSGAGARFDSCTFWFRGRFVFPGVSLFIIIIELPPSMFCLV